MWSKKVVFIFIFISAIQVTISEEQDERLRIIEEVVDQYKAVIHALQLVYYSERSSVCAIATKPSTQFDDDLGRTMCFVIEDSIFNALKDLMFAFTALTSDRYAEFSRERYMTAVDMALRIFQGMQPTSANKRLFEMRMFVKYAGKLIKKMEQYIISKFRYTRIC